jgi:flagellar biosynthesis/type III secretory pathway M-ring protein FliF/YscJ
MNYLAANNWVLAAFVIALVAIGFAFLWFVIFKPASRSRKTDKKLESEDYSDQTSHNAPG